MNWTSTRLNNDILKSCEAVIKGLAPDGGLYVPANIMPLSNFYNLIKGEYKTYTNYKMLATKIFTLFFDEFTQNEVVDCVNKAYSRFYIDDVVATTKIGDDHLLELYHGPTSAFKDVALTILPHFMTYAYKKLNINKKIYILCATSGDTGKAALEGFKNVDQTYITVFYPHNAVSKIQELQMTTTTGTNTNVVSVNGVFDDCQKIVKGLMSNTSRISNDCIFSVANSINIGRLIPQVVYYFHSYFTLVNEGTISLDEKINFCVPSANFGDIFAGYIAKVMGLPVNRLIIASNQNNVLTDFINTGIYNRNRQFYKTLSPSMDILVSSNFERLIYFATSFDKEKTNFYMNKLNTEGTYNVDKNCYDTILNDFCGYYASDEEIKNTIISTYKEKSRIIDTHTACGMYTLNEYKKSTNDRTKNVVLSTASVYKFVDNVLPLFANVDTKTLSLNDQMKMLYDLTGEEIPKNLLDIENLPVNHKDNISINEAESYIKSKCEKI